MSGQATATKRPNPYRRMLLAASLVLLVGLILAGIRWHQRRVSSTDDLLAVSSQPTDPRVRYDGPYRNIHPEVRYVGDAQCAGCHDDIARSYARHPMGRSVAAVANLVDEPCYGPDANNPFTAFGRLFQVERQGQRLWHRQTLQMDSSKPDGVELAQEVHWVIGSGAKGYSFLTEHDGYLFQTAISWFTQQQRWDLSPGFGPAVLAGRQVPASCLFCHASGIREHPKHPDRFMALTGEPPVPRVSIQAIGCERCHGPGARHVATTDRWDIVNPARLPPPLRDAVCEQCHLEGQARLLRAGRMLFDYRPGLPLHDFWSVLVPDRHTGKDVRAVNHVEQMHQSKCFSRSMGELKLGCITCHDPHAPVEPVQSPTYYRARCLKCHDGAKGDPFCSETPTQRKAVSPEDNCIACHMPRYPSSDIAHTASTDHRIIRRSTSGRTRNPARLASTPDLDNAVFLEFYRDRFPHGDSQTERNLGLGLIKLMHAGMLQPPRHADRALRFLEAALARDPTDVSVRAGKVDAYLLLQRPAEALTAAETLLPEQPGNWQLLAQAAHAAQASGLRTRACDYWRRAIEINPFVADYQVRLFRLLRQLEHVEEARKHGAQLLRLDPFNAHARQAWEQLSRETPKRQRQPFIRFR